MITREKNVSGRVYEILQEHLGSDIALSPESDLLNDLGMDSLEQVELGLKLEKDLGIKVSVRQIRNCITVEEVVQLVQHLASQRNALIA